MTDEDWEDFQIEFPAAYEMMQKQYAALQAGARSATTKPEDGTNKQYEDRIKSAIDRIREVAKERGQNVREDFIPRRPETPPATIATPAAPAAEPQARGATMENGTTPAPTAAQQPPWVRGVLPPWARLWVPSRYVSNTSGGQSTLQRIVLIFVFLVIFTMALFPPWIYVFSPPAELRGSYVRVERPAGYHFMSDHSPQGEERLLSVFNLSPREYERRVISLHLFSIRLDTSRLEVQIGVTLLLTAILYFALRGIQKPATR